MAGTGEVRGNQALPKGTAPIKAKEAAPPPPPPPPEAPKTAADGKAMSKKAKTAPLPKVDVEGIQVPKAPVPLPKRDIEAEVQELVKDAENDGILGEALEFWRNERKKDGAAGYVGAAMETLLEFSGLPAVQRSSAELGARVGAGDSNLNIAKAGGKLAFDSGMVILNGVAAAGALGSAGKAAKGILAGEAALEAAATTARVVRHYTTAETALKIMDSGEIWASAKGMAGNDKVYLLAEKAGERGMNFLRQANIGVAKTGVAIEIDLAKLPAEVAAKFRTEGFRGFLNQENFITHAGKFDFTAFRDAVKMVPTEKLATTFDQVLKAGGTLADGAAALVDFNRGVQTVAKGG